MVSNDYQHDAYSNYNSGYSTNDCDGGDEYEVCMVYKKWLDTCDKEDVFSEVCSADSAYSLVTDWASGNDNQICQTVCCGETAEFGLYDGDGDGCADYQGTYEATFISGATATCSNTGGTCSGGSGGDC